MHTSRPFHHHIHKTMSMVTNSLHIQAVSTFSVNVVSRILSWLLNWNVSSINCTQAMRKTMCSMKIVHFFLHIHLSKWQCYILSSKVCCHCFAYLSHNFWHGLPRNSKRIGSLLHTTFVTNEAVLPSICSSRSNQNFPFLLSRFLLNRFTTPLPVASNESWRIIFIRFWI